MNLAQAIVESRPKPQDAIKPRWATVVSMAPLRIRFDGEDNALNLKPVDLVGVSLNDRVWCQLYAGQVHLVGKFGGAVPAGSVQAFAGVNIPTGWLKANGATYNTVDYPALAAALGATGSTFTVPNYAGRTLVGRDTAQTEFNAIGKTGGAKTHTLSVSEMPSHEHVASTVGIKPGSSTGWFGSFRMDSYWNMVQTGGAYDSYGAGVLASGAAGGGGAHNNLQPYAVVDWIIKT